MFINVLVHYHNQPLTYKINFQRPDVFHLYLQEEHRSHKTDYIPEKIIIRRKGKIWVSDAENYAELTAVLTSEILKLSKRKA